MKDVMVSEILDFYQEESLSLERDKLAKMCQKIEKNMVQL